MEYSLEKEDIDPSDFTDEQLRQIIFNGVLCAKVVEEVCNDQASSRAAYSVIDHVDGVPHERTPSDLIQEEAMQNLTDQAQEKDMGY